MEDQAEKLFWELAERMKATPGPIKGVVLVNLTALYIACHDDNMRDKATDEVFAAVREMVPVFTVSLDEVRGEIAALKRNKT